MEIKIDKKIIKFPFDLWSHQTAAIQEFSLKDACALFWEVGTGKTLATVGILRSKYAQYNAVLPTLILTKTGVLRSWEKTIKDVSPEGVGKAVKVLYGEGKKKISGAQRTAMLADKDAKIFIVNFEALNIKVFWEALRKKDFSIVVVDESQTIKTHNSKTTQKVIELGDKSYFRAILTGTPILNSPLDIWGQWRFLDRGEAFTKNFFLFRNAYFVDKNAGMPPGKYFPNWQPKEDCNALISERISRFANRKKKSECLTLPPVVYMEENIELSEEQKKHYNSMLKELVTYINTEEATASNALVKTLRILQIVAGYVKLDDGTEVKLKDNPRLERLKELLLDLTPENKVVVWCTFRKNYTDIKELCDGLGIGTAYLTGDTKDKQGEIDRFRYDEKCRVMIANPSAGGVGVDGLQHAASYAIYYSRSYSLEHRLQSEGRTNRGGSEKFDCLTVIDLLAKGTLDEVVLAALKRKEDVANDILERLKNDAGILESI